jgi:hypothetical protein
MKRGGDSGVVSGDLEAGEAAPATSISMSNATKRHRAESDGRAAGGGGGGIITCSGIGIGAENRSRGYKCIF